MGVWQLDGRAAVAVGTQGWQATLNWRQRNDASEVHLAGPFGVGALVLKRTPRAVVERRAAERCRAGATAGAPGVRTAAGSSALLAARSARSERGFRTCKRNDQDRASQLTQDEWTIDYDRYMPVDGDLLPAHMVLSREGVRVRIAVDHWNTQQ